MSTIIDTPSIEWNVASLWNEVAYKEDRPLKARDYIYASELGYPYIDRFLKMKAIPYTNPPNARSQRKFLAGNIWENTVRQILIACGVFQYEEVKVDATPYADCLSVHGRLDFHCGGYIDGTLASIKVTELNLPDFLFTIAGRIIEALDGKTLEEKILELKAISTFAMDKIEKMRAPLPQHSLQGYHYQRNKGIQADVAYICKDDCRMQQFGVDAEMVEPIYKDDIEQMTHYFTKDEKPAPAPLARFDPLIGKFSKNLQVEYSPYLTMIYGFATPEDYRDSVKFVDKWNRTLSRFVLAETGAKTPTGKPISITPKNKESRAEIEAGGYNLDDLIQIRIELGAVEAEEETE